MNILTLKFAELHAPLFMSGSNLGTKLSPSTRTGLVLQYERKHGELLVGWKGETAIIPIANVVGMVPADIVVPTAASPAEAAPPAPKPTAQVETPQSHVFAGSGAGKTGQEGNRRAGK